MNVIALPVQHKSQTQRPVGRQEEIVNGQYAIVSTEAEQHRASSTERKAKTRPSSTALTLPPSLSFFVGRDHEFAQLHRLLDKAMTGERQVVLVTGEPGIGKTTLLDAFLAQIRERPDTRITSGQCIEQYGPGEAYLPLLEATTRLCRGPSGEQPVEDLRRYAPSWLLQLPGLLAPEDYTLLQQRVQGTSHERMLREMAEAAEHFSTHCRLVVVLEDLHWSDVATLEWLSYMARRKEPARLMILGTYRPVEMFANESPLRGIVQELHACSGCSEVRLTPLSAPIIQEYVARRCSGTIPPIELSASIHQRTEGNPLFMSTMVDYLFARGGIYESGGRWHFRAASENITTGTPDTIRQLIERQVERTSAEVQQVLEVASIVGVEFSAAEVAAGLQGDIEVLELQCERLARTGQFLRMEGVTEWPDGTLSGRYSFLHAVYREVIATRVGGMRYVQWHRRVADRKEAAYGERVGEIAAELAVHFEQGRSLMQAVHYLGKAGETAMRRNAHQEAIVHFSRGLALLATFPDTPERKRQELRLQVVLGLSSLRTKGYAAPEVALAYSRAQELCQQIGEQPELFRVLAGLCAFYLVRAELQTARLLAEQCLRLAQQMQDHALLVEAHFLLGVTLFYSGELLSARTILEQGCTFYDPEAHASFTAAYGQDPGVGCASYAALVAWFLGYADQALGKGSDSLLLARELSHSFTLGATLHTATWLYQYRREVHAVQAHAEEEILLSKEEGFALWLAAGTIQQGWAQGELGNTEKGFIQIREGIAALKATGAELTQPYYLALLAQAYAKNGQFHEGLVLLDQALTAIHTTGERYYEAEVYRLYGELLLQIGEWETDKMGEENPFSSFLPHSSPEACFLSAISIARQRQTRSLELRAATSLARLWQQEKKVEKARELLQAIYDWFTEGFATQDLQEAGALLVNLGGTLTVSEDQQKSKLKAQQSKPETESQEHQDSFLHIARNAHPASRLTQIIATSSSAYQSSDLEDRTLDCVFRSEGDYWTLAFDGKVCRVRDVRGLHYIAFLLRHPNDDIHSFRLVTGDEASGDRSVSDSQTAAADQLIPSVSDSGEMLDAHARAAYKQRIVDLQAELDEALAFHDQGRIGTVREELDLLTHELARAVGLGGHARRVGSPAERARITATKSIKNALRKISEHHGELGYYLKRTIKTGTFCVYAPDPRAPVAWQF